MFTKEDIIQIEQRGIQLSNLKNQVQNFEVGFPPLSIIKPAIAGDGILILDAAGQNRYAKIYNTEIKEGAEPQKLIPASGAASRMFKQLFTFLEKKGKVSVDENYLQQPENEFENIFLKHLTEFACYADLKAAMEKVGLQIETADPFTIVDYLLNEKGLNYGKLPKALLQFHKYEDFSRTSAEEHLVEGARFCKDNKNNIFLHFTVSPEHMSLFKKLMEEKQPFYEEKFGVKYTITYSVQNPATDMLAVDLENQPFRTPDGKLLFRPGGHGALLENLNNLEGDLIFIKNIDNIVPDRLRYPSVIFKEVMGGILLEKQEKIFNLLYVLDKNEESIENRELNEIASFIERELSIILPSGLMDKSKSEVITFLRNKLNRPIRVCGMVVNTGEPGGGPFWVENEDGSISLQIIEDAQIDRSIESHAKAVNGATHFNPADIVAGTRDYKGEKLNLLQYRDPKTGIITEKSAFGKTLKAQELPGLWNGSMSDWISIFIEIPIETFNPVKTINDLLRPEHCAIEANKRH